MSPEAALYYLLVQTGDSFVVLDQSNDIGKMTLVSQYIYSKSLCNPAVVGWDLFATENEANHVRDRLLSLKLTTTCDSSSSASEDIPFEHVPESSETNLEPPTHEIEVTSFVAEDAGDDSTADNQEAVLTIDDDSDLDFMLPSKTGKTNKKGQDDDCVLDVPNISDEVASASKCSSVKKRLNMNVGKPGAKVPKLVVFRTIKEDQEG